GHTSFSFALAVWSATVASRRGYRWSPLVSAVVLTLATTTGYLRVAADRHYLTVVAAGAAVGSTLGIAIPYLFHHLARDAPPSIDGGALEEGWSYVATVYGALRRALERAAPRVEKASPGAIALLLASVAGPPLGTPPRKRKRAL
ncbi:MAG: phosphoesterase PA-phosphatase related, partial [Myxococcaceae bacterium]|nr:phosphoesterase PA-phosphatase related [Myxococcaceae bacterium]